MSLTASPLSDDRLHGLDALRGIALLLGVVLHTLMSFFPVPIWVVVDDQTSPVASTIFFAIHLFRMTTFFLIAGLFAHMMPGPCLACGGWRWPRSSPYCCGTSPSRTAAACPRTVRLRRR